MKRYLVAAALIGFTHVHAPVAAAQDPSPGSVDLAAMLGTSTGGVYFARATVGLDLLGALRITELSSGARILAAEAGVQFLGPFFKAKVGLAETGAGTGTSSAREFPELTWWSALVGWQSGHAGEPSWRLLVGPTWYADGAANLGATVRADIVTRTVFHFALTATGRGSVVSKLPGGATSLWAAGIGVRVR